MEESFILANLAHRFGHTLSDQSLFMQRALGKPVTLTIHLTDARMSDASIASIFVEADQVSFNVYVRTGPVRKTILRAVRIDSEFHTIVDDLSSH